MERKELQAFESERTRGTFREGGGDVPKLHVKEGGKRVVFWPGGSRYEGGWEHGLPQGQGTWTSEEVTYVGSWCRGRPHGAGRVSYASGDVYEGSWFQGLPHGIGKYLWTEDSTPKEKDIPTSEGRRERQRRNGSIRIHLGNLSSNGLTNHAGSYLHPSNPRGAEEGMGSHDEYSGEWMEGERHGRGTQLWCDGTLYDGQWEHDREHGTGMYVDGRDRSIFHGTWKHGKRHGTGLWMPGTMQGGTQLPAWTSEEERDTSPRTSKEVQGTSERPPLPRVEHYEDGVLAWTSPATEEDVEEVLRRTYPPTQVLGTRRNSLKVPGETIFKGHRSYDLVRSLQLGLRYSVMKMTPSEATQSSVKDKEQYSSLPQAEEMDKDVLYEAIMDFKWKDYCPMAFAQLRSHFGIETDEYIGSLCSENSLREMSSPGKSVSMFYLTRDGRFMIKTIRRDEVNFLRSMLPSYYRHVRMNRGTIVTKFFGLHRIEPQHGKKVRFVVMGNLFRTDLQLQRRFDLKGSTLGRFTSMQKYPEETCTLKDLDLNCRFQLNPIVRQRFFTQLSLDCQLLEALSVMDYSLLVGVHFIDRNAARAMMQYPDKELKEGRESAEQPLEQLLSMNANAEIAIASTQLSKLSLLGRSAPESHSVGMRMSAQLVPGPPALVRQEGGPTVECPLLQTTQVLIYCGVIDILQEFTARKHLEATLKGSVHGKMKVSAADPTTYRRRFESFLAQVFI